MDIHTLIRISSSTCPSPRYSHLEIWTLPSPSCLSVLRCLGVASGVRRIRDACFAWFNSGYMFYERLLANFTYFLRAVHSDPWCSSPFRRMEKCAQLMLRVAVSLRAVRTLNLDIISTSFPCDGVEVPQYTVHRLFSRTFQLCNTDGYVSSSIFAYGCDDGLF